MNELHRVHLANQKDRWAPGELCARARSKLLLNWYWFVCCTVKRVTVNSSTVSVPTCTCAVQHQGVPANPIRVPVCGVWLYIALMS